MEPKKRRPHWRDLPQKPHRFTTLIPHQINVICVGDHWDPSTNKLSVDGLIDVSDADGKAFLASDLAQVVPPVQRVFRVDEDVEGLEAFFLLAECEGEMVLGLARLRDLTV
jgi:hypothetical protein